MQIGPSCTFFIASTFDFFLQQPLHPSYLKYCLIRTDYAKIIQDIPIFNKSLTNIGQTQWIKSLTFLIFSLSPINYSQKIEKKCFQ